MSSAFATKLGTNYCPNVEEAAELKALLVEPVLRLKRLDDEIVEMQRAIDKLTEERNHVAAYISAHRALLSPVRTLPLDIIQEIFGACLPTDRNCVMSASEAPVLLGRICSSWRAISLSTPSLWANIHIAETTSPLMTHIPSVIFQKKMAQRIEIIKTWLSRSGHCPLSISLAGSTSEWTMVPFMEAILSFAHRWQHIRLAVSEVALEVLGRLTPTDVPILRGLWLNNVRFPFDWSRLEILRAAHISRLGLWGPGIKPEALSLRWDQLTELDIRDTSWQLHLTNEVILKIISKCSRLRCCKLMFTHRGWEHIDVAGPTIEITSLRTFSLHTNREALGIIAVLGRLALPNLRHFSFSGFVKCLQAVQAVEQEDQTLCRFLNTTTQLETFSMRSEPFSKSFLLQTLHSLPPTLRHLEIMVDIERVYGGGIPTETPISPFDDDCLRALNADPTRPYLFPKLQTLYITCCPRISDEAILEFIPARMALEECSLKLVHFGVERHAEVDISRLRPFVDAGLDLSVAYLQPISFSPWLGLPAAPGVLDTE
ncbi:hypothetical protein GGX14DRAFT_457755 [Mycena pura]|uniref:F-box domain-containing protein n=1 Tax=Mycena pura TaxID=153505 RepID=A0AAD6V8P5_9AGAR|nr:hypothetical protein GGX14DRAFT_457755 [Mycena pura]